MPRQPRFNLVGVPQHVVQRGNNRQATFFTDADYQRYIDYVASAAAANPCDVHAYVLMPNHIHMLVTPRAPDALSKLMQSVAGRYVQYVNASQGRSGTLWDGRYKASIVDSERYLLTCYRYIELNPVRAGMVRHPADYRWSSYRHNGRGDAGGLIVQHPLYEALGASPKARRVAYRALFRGHMEESLLRRIREALNQERALAGERFSREIEARLARPVRPARRGRPSYRDRKAPADTSRDQKRN